MKKPLVLVTGAAGGVGAALVSDLRARDVPVRAAVRRLDGRADRLRGLGAEVVVADLYDSDQLVTALRGVERAFYLPPIRPYVIQSAVAFAVAAREVGVEHIVAMSQWTAHRAHPANMTRQTWLMDQLFAMLPGVAHTVVNPGMFAHNFLRTIDLAALLGVYPVLATEGYAAPVSNEDMARVAATILIDGPSRHAGKSYRPTGPALLGGADMARIVAKVVGRSVKAVNMPIWLLSKVARQQGIDPFEIASLRHYIQDIRKGTFSFGGGVTNVVEELTGVPAESFETTARRYAALPFARPTLANRVKAFLRFNAALLYPAYDFERWERRMAIPLAVSPSLAIEDAVWRDTHHAQMLGGATPALFIQPNPATPPTLGGPALTRP